MIARIDAAVSLVCRATGWAMEFAALAGLLTMAGAGFWAMIERMTDA